MFNFVLFSNWQVEQGVEKDEHKVELVGTLHVFHISNVYVQVVGILFLTEKFYYY